MNKIIKACTGVIAAASLAVSLSSCTPGNNTPGATIAGAGAGALLGAAAFHGSGAWVGILGASLLGGIVGNQIGQYMDRQDQANMQSAIVQTPVGREASWTNDKDVTYTVRPTRDYHVVHHHRRQYCREFTTRVNINGRTNRAYGTACRQPDGSWKIVRS